MALDLSDPQTVALLRLQGILPPAMPDGSSPLDGVPVDQGGSLVPGIGVPASVVPAAGPDQVTNGPQGPLAASPPASPSSPPPPVDSSLAGSPPFQATQPSQAPAGPQATIGQATGQPIPNGVAETGTGEPVPAPAPSDVDAISGGMTPAQAAAGPPPTPPAPPPPTVEQRLSAAADDAINSTGAVLGVGMVDPKTGQLKSPSPEDLDFKANVLSDQSLKEHLQSIDAERVLATQHAQLAGPAYSQYAADANRIAAEKQAEMTRYIAQVRQGYEQAQQAAQQANDAYPNPDDLLGGKGSWARAMSLGLASAFAGVPGSSIANVIDQQLRLQMAGRQATYDQLQAKAKSLAGIAESQSKAIPGVAAGYDAMLNAAKDRLASQLDVVANKMAPSVAQKNALDAVATLKGQVSKDQYAAGKTVADTQQAEAEAYAKGFYKGQPLVKPGSGGGAGGSGTSTGKYTVSTNIYNPFVSATDKNGNTAPVPVMALTKLTPDDRKATEQKISIYAKEQTLWAKLHAVGARMKYHKSLGAAVSSQFSDTDQKDYDAARTELISLLTKDMGVAGNETGGGGSSNSRLFDKMASTVPETATVWNSADPEDLIRRGEASNDELFMDDMNTAGIDGASIVKGARAQRTPPPPPTAEQDLMAGQQLLANAKTQDDRQRAKALIANATGRIAQEKVQEQGDDAAEKQISLGASPVRQEKIDPSLPPGLQASVVARNNLADTFTQKLTGYRKLLGENWQDKSKLPGDIDAAKRQHNLRVARAAEDVLSTHKTLDSNDSDLVGKISDSLFSLSLPKLRALASVVGVDPNAIDSNYKDMMSQVTIAELQGKLKKVRGNRETRKRILKAFFGD